MKSLSILVALLIVITLLHASKAIQLSGIGGKVSPLNSVDYIWVIQGKDSLRSVPANGIFMIETKPGSYKVIIDAKPNFRDVLFENVEVEQGKTTDLGEIKISP